MRRAVVLLVIVTVGSVSGAVASDKAPITLSVDTWYVQGPVAMMNVTIEKAGAQPEYWAITCECGHLEPGRYHGEFDGKDKIKLKVLTMKGKEQIRTYRVMRNLAGARSLVRSGDEPGVFRALV